MSNKKDKNGTHKTPPHQVSQEFSEILNVLFTKRKRSKSSYSVRAYARDLGVSHTVLNRVLNGKYNFSLQAIPKIVDKLDLSPLEKRKYLFKLRLLSEKDPEVRKFLEEKSPESRTSRVREIVRLRPEDFETDGLFAVILLLAYLSIKSSRAIFQVDEIRETTKMDHAAVKRMLNKLSDVGFLKKREPNVFEKLGKRWEVEAQDHAMPLKKVHRQALRIVSERIIRFRPKERYSATEVMAIPPDNLGLLQERCDAFIDDLRSITDTSPESSNRVYIVSVHAVPWI